MAKLRRRTDRSEPASGQYINAARFIEVLDDIRASLSPGRETSHDTAPAARATNGATNSKHAAPSAPADPAPPRPVFRYYSALRANQSPDKLPLSETRLKVLKAVHRAYKNGLRARDLMDRTRLTHGSIQQTLNWLREHDLVKGEPESE